MTEGTRRRKRRRSRGRRARSRGDAAVGELTGARPLDAAADACVIQGETARAARRTHRSPAPRLAAIDLGTNNCRLLVASLRDDGFRIVDAYSRIVRLGEGVAQSGALSEAAMERAIAALRICAGKVVRRGVTHGRYIATQACRSAANGAAFLDRVRAETGLDFEVIPAEEEARLAVRGCAPLLDPTAKAGLIFDIGGGSTEISWARIGPDGPEIVAWTSLPIGVVTLSETWGGREIGAATYAQIVETVRGAVRAFGDPGSMKGAFLAGGAHFLGTSGTVTSIAGVHLGLARYRRDRVDGLWLSRDDARAVTERLREMNFDARAAEPCIGAERADLVVCGCAILDALLQEWPTDRIRVADRGLREGILADLADEIADEGAAARGRLP